MLATCTGGASPGGGTGNGPPVGSRSLRRPSPERVFEGHPCAPTRVRQAAPRHAAALRELTGVLPPRRHGGRHHPRPGARRQRGGRLSPFPMSKPRRLLDTLAGGARCASVGGLLHAMLTRTLIGASAAPGAARRAFRTRRRTPTGFAVRHCGRCALFVNRCPHGHRAPGGQPVESSTYWLYLTCSTHCACSSRAAILCRGSLSRRLARTLSIATRDGYPALQPP